MDNGQSCRKSWQYFSTPPIVPSPLSISEHPTHLLSVKESTSTAMTRHSFQAAGNMCRRFFALPASRKLMLMRTAMVVFILRLAVSLCSLQRILRTLGRLSARKRWQKGLPLDDILYASAVVSRRLPFATCLVNGLAGQYLLARNGYHPTLHIGVKKEADRVLAAHAWVTIDQRVVIGMIDDLDTYTPFSKIG